MTIKSFYLITFLTFISFVWVNGQTTILTEDFESGFPTGWSTQTLGGNAWSIGGTPCGAGGSNQMRSTYSASSDAWLFTLGITLTKNYSYTIKINNADNLRDLKVYAGSAPDKATMIGSGTLMHTFSLDPNCSSVQTSDANFVPSSTGTYYFAFWHDLGSSGPEIDNIEIIETPPACTYPTIQASITSITSVTSNSATLTWSRGDGDSVLVVARKNSSTLTEPTDAGIYFADSQFGSGAEIGTGNYVLYKGVGTTVNISELDHLTQYQFYVYEFNSAGPCYLRPGDNDNTTTLRSTTYFINNNLMDGSDIYTTAIGDDANPGTRPSVPKRYLKSLLSTYSGSFLAGDTIFIDAGIWTDSDPINEDAINITDDGLTIVGAGIGKTIYDNNYQGGANGVHFMNIQADNFTMSKLTVTEYGTWATSGYGHALTLDGVSNATFNDLELFRNGWSSSGLGTVLVKSNTSATFNGGGNSCNATPGSRSHGGGFFVDGTGITLDINYYAIVRNFHDFEPGPALYIFNADATTTVNMRNVLMDSCVNAFGGGGGGAIKVENGNLNIYDSKILKNEIDYNAIYTGSGICITGGNVVLKRSIIANNKHSDPSGNMRAAGIGINGNGISLTVDSCSFYGNQDADWANDIYSEGTGNTVLCRNSTFLSSGKNIGHDGGTTFTIADCGIPTEHSGTIIKSNTNSPSYNATPNTPGYTGSCVSSIVLPVTLAYFVGHCDQNKAILEWTTLSEANNAYFIIEKSSDLKTYTEIGVVEGAGFSNTMKKYSFIDELPNPNQGYYRLSQVDYDGKKTYHNIIRIEDDCDDIFFDFKPVYVDGRINLNYYSDLNMKVQIELFDITGKLVGIWDEKIEKNSNSIVLNPSSKLSHGIYILSLVGDSRSTSKKFFVE